MAAQQCAATAFFVAKFVPYSATMHSDKQRIKIQANVLFTHNGNGRMVNINELEGEAAPRFFMGRTREGHICRFRHDVPNEVAEQICALVEREPIPQDLHEPPLYLEEYKRILESHAPIQHMHSGPAYYFPEVLPVSNSAVSTRMTRDNATALEFDFPWITRHLEAMPPVFAVVLDGRAVALCFSSRLPVGADEAGVFVLEGYRGRGYAAVVVAGWAAAIRELGRIPLYSTDWTNLASQQVAKKLGLVMYGEDVSIA